MSPLTALTAGQDATYASLGVAATWTPAGGAAVACTALLSGGDQGAQFKGLVARLNTRALTARVRVRELAATAPGVAPRKGDQVSLGEDIGTLVADQVGYVLNSDPRHPTDDPRELEWQFELTLA